MFGFGDMAMGMGMEMNGMMDMQQGMLLTEMGMPGLGAMQMGIGAMEMGMGQGMMGIGMMEMGMGMGGMGMGMGIGACMGIGCTLACCNLGLAACMGIGCTLSCCRNRRGVFNNYAAEQALLLRSCMGAGCVLACCRTGVRACLGRGCYLGCCRKRGLRGLVSRCLGVGCNLPCCTKTTVIVQRPAQYQNVQYVNQSQVVRQPQQQYQQNYNRPPQNVQYQQNIQYQQSPQQNYTQNQPQRQQQVYSNPPPQQQQVKMQSPPPQQQVYSNPPPPQQQPVSSQPPPQQQVVTQFQQQPQKLPPQQQQTLITEQPPVQEKKPYIQQEQQPLSYAKQQSQLQYPQVSQYNPQTYNSNMTPNPNLNSNLNLNPNTYNPIINPTLPQQSILYQGHLFKREGLSWGQHPSASISSTCFMSMNITHITKLKIKSYTTYKDSLFMKITTYNTTDHFFGTYKSEQLKWFENIVLAKLHSYGKYVDITAVDFNGIVEGYIMRKSQFFGNWDLRYVKIDNTGLKSFREKNVPPTIQFTRIQQLWTRFEIIHSNQYFVIKCMVGGIKYQYGIPLPNLMLWIKAFYSMIS